MDLVAQASASTVPVPPEMMGELRSSMDELLELDESSPAGAVSHVVVI